MSRQSFPKSRYLYRDRVSCVMTKCSRGQEALCRDIAFCVTIGLGKAQSFLLQQRNSGHDRVGKGRGRDVAIESIYVTTWLARIGKIFCHDKEFLGRDRSSHDRKLCRTRKSYVFKLGTQHARQAP